MVFFNNLDPTLLSIGPLELRWYGLMYVAAFLVVYFYARSRITKKKIDLTLPQLDTIMFWLTISMIIGARLFNVVFYNFSYFLSHPLEIFFIWQGGLSFFGGLIGMVIAACIMIKQMKVSFWKLADLFIVPLALGQALGRIGNFFNHELYGTITSLPWGVNFKTNIAGKFLPEVNALGDFVFRHPNQLYEVGYDLVIFFILFTLRNKGYLPGSLFAIFLMLYGVFRFITEFFRTDDPIALGLTIGQFFNILTFIVGGAVLYLLYRKK